MHLRTSTAAVRAPIDGGQVMGPSAKGPTLRSVTRWTVGVVVIVHGLIHLLGAAKGLGWAEVSQLREPIGAVMGGVWLLSCLAVIGAGVMSIAGIRLWWAVAGVAAVVSQVAIVTSWSDAKAGTAANVLLLAAATYGFRSEGPTSFRARFTHLAKREVDAVTHMAVGELVMDRDLAHLPSPVAGYVRAVGAVGRPRVVGFHADISGRIRSGPDQPWMRFTGEQVNTYGVEPSRVFRMYAAMRGIPADVLHTYLGSGARMQVRLGSMRTLVDAHGPAMTRAETVTLLNDLCVLAPAALVDAPIEWSPIDDRHALATYTNAGHTVRAVLTFDDTGDLGGADLIDFVSDDRLRSSSDGRTFTRQRWSTPLGGYRRVDGRRVASVGRGRWHPVDGAAFDYLEFHIDAIAYIETSSAQVDRHSFAVGVVPR
jgi:hypothetical protein